MTYDKEESWAKTWVRRGLLWALFMYAAATFIYPLIAQEPITEISVLVGIPIWLIVGLGFGYAMKMLANKKGK